ncbi:T9SS type B sorting domain-containing protein [Polluticaenibacter yanchengensis]|uniref:Gliding motility-associated C-terminal domain-containing protein n=1 Tax=Polluticaenibacter yanchengensis TaxID=3014562 RepID=A0ABT4UKH6_9BACT|nr:gliding motility-associated C-terminal domain-containing protein [Chitinophagaceae bacterium LY-5]
MLKYLFRNIALILIVIFGEQNHAFAQCITTFPAKFDFENDNGGFTTGGQNSDWAWGKPNKSVIKNAASGNNCWITGGLNKTTYNGDELAWIQSPCFDFRNLQYPYVNFQIVWESERTFDGATLQYSVNGGTWQQAGSASQSVNCITKNWYNTTSIRYLSFAGWSGSSVAGVGGGTAGGSTGQWVNAGITLPQLAGVANVRFRFLFGAGSVYNGYNGVAIDDFEVSEAPANEAAFSFTCNGNNNRTFIFNNESKQCPTSYTWDFGDPASGTTNNRSTQTHPAHTFSAPGVYNVTLTASGPDNKPSTITKTVVITDVQVNVLTDNKCAGGAGAIAALNILPATGISYQVKWNTNNPQSGLTATNLSQGNYSVVVEVEKGCTIERNFTISDPDPVTGSSVNTNPGCGMANGAIEIEAEGGLAPYRYLVNGTTYNNPSIPNLAEGNYKIEIIDANGCKAEFSADLKSGNFNVALENKNDPTCAAPAGGSISILPTGTFALPLKYEWSNGQTGASITRLGAGTYTITVTDNNNCKATLTETLKAPEALNVNVVANPTTCNADNGNYNISVTNGRSPYIYTVEAPDGNTYTTNIKGQLKPGIYKYLVTDNAGCTGRGTFEILKGPAATVTHSFEQISCFGKNDGKIIFNTTSNNASIKWNDGSTAWTRQNLAPGLYSYDYKDNNDGCQSTGVFQIIEPAGITINGMVTPATCQLSNGTIKADISGGNGTLFFQWKNAVTEGLERNNLSAGIYTLEVSDMQGCTNEKAFEVAINNPLVIDLGKDSTICSGSIINLGLNGYDTYLWNTGTTTNTIAVTEAGNYWLKVTDSRGCQATDTIKFINSCGSLYFPNAFTPNDDGRNDRFGPAGQGLVLPMYELMVFDRWGKKIFESKNPDSKWDGTYKGNKLQTGAYIWKVVYVNYLGITERQHGTITLIR